MDCFASKITSGGNPDPLQPSEEFFSQEFRYLIISETGTACLDVMHAELGGDLASVVNDPQSGIHATVVYELTADEPERSDAGDLFDLEEFNMQMPFCVAVPTGFLTLRLRIRNDSGQECGALNGSILFAFMVMPEHVGDDTAPGGNAPSAPQGGGGGSETQGGKIVPWYSR